MTTTNPVYMYCIECNFNIVIHDKALRGLLLGGSKTVGYKATSIITNTYIDGIIQLVVSTLMNTYL